MAIKADKELGSNNLEPNSLEYKFCTKCRNKYHHSNFYKKKKGTKLRSECKTCTKLEIDRYKEENPFFKELKKYGITLEDYNRMVDEQKGKCAICSTHQKDLKRRLIIDHNHKTGEIRGLLCIVCNGGLGYFKDDPKITDRATNYLIKKGNYGKS